MKNKHKIICIGEILWDSLPGGLFLGGAPFNVACHLTMLGEDVSFVSRIGDDELGNQILRRLPDKNIETDFLQRDVNQKTGLVNVTLTHRDNPEYEIVEPVAWDFIEAHPALTDAAATVDALVFGTLAQRNKVSRDTIQALRKKSRFNVYDINLRPPYDNPELVEASLQDAHLAKLNEQEMQQMAVWFQLPNALREGAIALSKTFNCAAVCVTKGGDGAALWHKNEWTEHQGFKIDVRDTVGSGDAFLAALISGILADVESQHILEFANAVGAWVATNEGATPALNFDEIKALQAK